MVHDGLFFFVSQRGMAKCGFTVSGLSAGRIRIVAGHHLYAFFISDGVYE